MTQHRPVRLAITLGDVAGVGPEVTLRALHTLAAELRDATPILFGALEPLRQCDAMLCARDPSYTSLIERVAVIPTPDTLVAQGAIGLVESTPGVDWSALAWGRHDARAARLQLTAFTQAIEAARAGEVDAIVTAPWNKAALKLIDAPPTGHTELLASAFDAPAHVMMLAGPLLRVALVTTHIPLAGVSARLASDPSRITATIETTGLDLVRRFHIAHPRLAVCGLNPHAGEGGVMGDEESRILAPAIDAARARHPDWTITDPLPSDTLFAKFAGGRQPFDAVVCMYHDQGLIPLKLLHFGESANMTLGLPILRTSADHGTAYDIAGQGVADAGSMTYALRLAAQLASA